MLMTALLHEDIDNIDQALVKRNSEKIQSVVVNVLSGMQKSFAISHDGISLLDGMQLLTLDNTLVDLCFDWHPNHIGVKSFPLSALTETNIHDMLLQAINRRVEELAQDDRGASENQRREDVTLTVTTLKKYLFFK